VSCGGQREDKADEGSSLPAEGRLTRVRVRAIHSPNQLGEAAPELEVSLGEGATLPDLLGPLRRSPVGGHQFGQVVAEVHMRAGIVG
jgi:hypothetical protein